MDLLVIGKKFKKSIAVSLITLFTLLLFTVTSATLVKASTLPLEELADKASYHNEQQFVGYRDVEKTGTREVEKIGYNDIEIPIYEWVKSEDDYGKRLADDWTYIEYQTYYHVFPRNNINGGYNIEKSDNRLYKKTITEPWTELKTITKTVPYIVYEDIYTNVYSYSAKQATETFTKPNKSTKLIGTNSNGRKYEVLIPKSTKVTKYNSSWYKSTISYSNYVKVKNKWRKETKVTTVYVPSKYIVTTTKKVKTGRKSITKYKTVTEQIQVPVQKEIVAWDTRKQISSTIEKEPYTYMETETYTYTVQEPIYETVKVKNTEQQKYQAIINYYWQYGLSDSELIELFNLVGVKATSSIGYDKSRYVTGIVTVNGISTPYNFNPNTMVELIVFNDNTAINLSYLKTVFRNGYEDVRINNGNYVVN